MQGLYVKNRCAAVCVVMWRLGVSLLLLLFGVQNSVRVYVFSRCEFEFQPRSTIVVCFGPDEVLRFVYM